MTALVDDLLLARLDAGRPLDHETVDLTEMVVNAVSDAHAASPDHIWQFDLPDEPVEIQGDPARLHQIVANLLGNARTHTAPGTVVRTSIVRDADQVRLTVRDNGPGVPGRSSSPTSSSGSRAVTPHCNRTAGSTGLGLHRRGRRSCPWGLRLPRQPARRHHLHRAPPRPRAGSVPPQPRIQDGWRGSTTALATRVGGGGPVGERAERWTADDLTDGVEPRSSR